MDYQSHCQVACMASRLRQTHGQTCSFFFKGGGGIQYVLCLHTALCWQHSHAGLEAVQCFSGGGGGYLSSQISGQAGMPRLLRGHGDALRESGQLVEQPQGVDLRAAAIMGSDCSAVSAVNCKYERWQEVPVRACVLPALITLQH